MLVTVFAALVGAVGFLTFIAWQESRVELASVQLRFGSDVSSEAVVALLSSIAGLPRAVPVIIEVRADEQGLVHRLHTGRSTLDGLQAQLRGVLPSLRFDPISDTGEPSWTTAVRLRWSGAHPVLQASQVEQTTAALLGSFAYLGRHEELRLCWLLSATRRPRIPQAASSRGKVRPWFMPPDLTPEQLRAVRMKYAGPVIRGRAVLMARSGNQARAQQLLSRITTLLRSRSSSWGWLSIRSQRALPLVRLAHSQRRGSLFSPDELAGLIGFPVAAPRIPGLSLSTAPQLMPASSLPTRGRVFARSNWSGMEHRLLAQPSVGGLSHALICGPTGSGKSHLLASLIVQDMQVGRGCLVLDGKGDLAEDVLRRIPPARARDVIVLDPGGGLPLPGLRVFGRGSDPELTADLVLGIFRELFADTWGVRSDQWLRTGLVTLAHDEQSTLADVPFLFSDARYRASLVSRVRDPLILETWAAFEAMSVGERTQQLGSPLTKIMEVIGRRVVRGVLAQTDPTLDMRAVLREGKVVIVALSAGMIGTPAARLVGALVVHELFQAVQDRASLAPERRRPFFAYIDEPKVLGDMPVPLDSLFELARGLGVGLTLGVQSLAQLPKVVQQAALTNAATIVAFKQAADDAQLLVRELVSLRADELQGLDRFEVAIRLGLGPGDVAPVATGVTLPLPEQVSDPRAMRQASAKRYGRPIEAVDAALRERHKLPGSPSAAHMPDAPVGRLRRSS